MITEPFLQLLRLTHHERKPLKSAVFEVWVTWGLHTVEGDVPHKPTIVVIETIDRGERCVHDFSLNYLTGRIVIWLAGGRNLKVEVTEGDFDDLLRRGNEGVKDAVDVCLVDLWVIWWRKDALLTVISTSLIADVTATAATAAGRSTSSAVNDTLTCYTRTFLYLIIFAALPYHSLSFRNSHRHGTPSLSTCSP